jgi:hypothetical protein
LHVAAATAFPIADATGDKSDFQMPVGMCTSTLGISRMRVGS